MRIRFLQALSGPETQCDVGSAHDWPDEEEAQRFIDAGIAEQPDAEPEEARAEQPETADVKRRRGK